MKTTFDNLAGRFVLALLIATAVPGIAVAQPRSLDPHELVRRSRQAQATLEYEGDQVTEVRAPGRPARVTRQQVWRRGARLRIEYETGQVRVDDGQRHTFYIPRLRRAERGPSLTRGAAPPRGGPPRGGPPREGPRGGRPGRPSAGRPDARLLRSDRVAGRPVQVVQLSRPGGEADTTLWIDRETSLPLRVDAVRGDQATSTYFTRIDFSAKVADSRFDLQMPAGVVILPPGLRPINRERAEAMAKSWGGLLSLTQPPAGYRLRGYFSPDVANERTLAVLYANPSGQTLMLFQGLGPGPGGGDELDGVRVLQQQRGNAKVTLVGPLAAAAMARAMASVR